MTPAEILRACWRGLWLLCVLLWYNVEARNITRAGLPAQEQWRRRRAANILRILHVTVSADGPAPTSGMVVSNHLGYLDVLVYGALLGTVFVSKAEVAQWPLLGGLARAAGTIFVDRSSARSAAGVNREIATRLQAGQQVLVFPEGTSSGGDSVLPFHTPLFEAPQRSGAPIWPAAVAYNAPLSHGTVAERICYWGDMTLAPHLFGVLGVRHIRAHVVFSPTPVTAADRRSAAEAAHTAVVSLHQAALQSITPAA